MWPYWLFFYLFLLNALIHIGPSLLSINGRYLIRPSLLSIKGRYWSIEWVSIYIFLVLIVGLRYQVGGDWYPYAENLSNTDASTFDFIYLRDPGFEFLNWLAALYDQEIGLFPKAVVLGGKDIYFLSDNIWTLGSDQEIVLVNFISAIFFSYGLVIFCRNQALPSLSMLVAIPFLVIVVAMSATRQSIALGFFMLGLVALENGNFWRYIKLILFSAFFHASALLLLPLAMVVGGRKLFIKMLALFLFFVTLFFFMGGMEVGLKWLNYIKSIYFHSKFSIKSPGTIIRYVMVLLPVLILLLNINRLITNRISTSIYAIRLWKVFALSSFVMIIPLIFIQSTTVVDRVLLYWLPLQLFVYGNIPVAYLRNKYIYIVIYLMIVLYSLMVIATWFTFANNFNSWIPYSSYLWL